MSLPDGAAKGYGGFGRRREILSTIIRRRLELMANSKG